MKISIITPTYNRSDLIERAIKSILNQTYSNFEMIIVDDASKDNTSEIVNKYINDSRIKFIQLSTNKGVNVARNIGIANISPDAGAVTFLDSDDEFFPDALEKMRKTLDSHPQINSFRFGVKYDNDILASNNSYVNKIIDFNNFIKDIFVIGEWVCTYRISIINNGFKYNEDVNAFEIISYIGLALHEKQFFSPDFVRIYHTGHESISNEKMSPLKIENALKAYTIILNLYGEHIARVNKKIYGRYLYIISYFYMLNGQKKKGIEYNFKGLKYSPFDLRFIRNFLKII
ncbi:glycosyltransferase family 2 protein [Chryseobacterium gallinarum]|uniref:Glycosyltransferase family 2 protein n=1 Tax=Chryseobacterium gallinarum TaxID=1324352 RepID=A0ABX6KXM2_CHRGL|nr:glycosyltransferase family 2 protein [Chryseobacterium gallinarum]MCL8535274.1 glycosyltransferase family 2 protein [Chryseobacterium gallinarum]QIY92589.1 glycosyltransferase family 2 protein [Chryseobacterium gallinarum]